MTRRTAPFAALAALALFVLLPVSSAPARAAAATTYDFEACTQGWTSTVPAPNPSWHRTPGGDGSSWAMSNPAYDGDPAVPAILSPIHSWAGGKMTITYSARWQYEHPATGIDTMNLSWTDDPNPKTKAWKRIQVFGGVTNTAFPSYNKFTSSITPGKGIVRFRFQMTGDALVFGAGSQVDSFVVPTAAPKGATC